MNIKLSVFSSRTKGKSAYGVYVNGNTIGSGVHKAVGDNIKENVLVELAKGLRECRVVVSHDDILYVEIQNVHLCQWLDGRTEYKGYSEFLDAVFDVLESLDCRYKFMFVKNPIAKQLVEEGKTEMQGQSIRDAFSDLE